MSEFEYMQFRMDTATMNAAWVQIQIDEALNKGVLFGRALCIEEIKRLAEEYKAHGMFEYSMLLFMVASILDAKKLAAPEPYKLLDFL